MSCFGPNDQVIQVFLVTALSSSASAVITAIVNDPGSATSILLEEDVEGGEDQGAVTEAKAGPAPNGVSPGNHAVVDDATGEAENTQGPRRRGQDSMTNFYHPAVTAPIPFIWIPQDPLGMSKEEIRDTEAVGDIQITDGGATLDEKSKMAVLNWWRWTMQGGFIDG
jgi:Extracellular tail, of 10TM putative phosphate transporter